MVITKIKQPTKAVLKKISLLRSQTLESTNFLQPLVLPNIKGITNWEELECLGYNPELSRIEAVVNIKRSSGYSGGMCATGSPEFVRFFIDYNDGNGFQDLGFSSFRAYDISDAPAGPQHPIANMVYKNINVSNKKKFCNNEVIVTLRAVLSWNDTPSNDPNQTPVYGNVMDAEAVLKPFKFVFPFPPIIVQPSFNPLVKELIEENKLVENTEKIDVNTFIKESIANDISASRAITQLMTTSLSTSNGNNFVNDFQNIDLSNLGINFDDLLIDLGKKDFNTNFEEIISVGLNSAEDTLGAVINIKRPSGYGGNLCQNGSLEYVSFFADFNNNGIFEEYLGTTNVKVNDIQNIPAEGLKYGVFLKTNLYPYLKDCGDPQIIRIRAILSWANPPDPSNPNQDVAWGNRMDVLVRLRAKSGTQTSIIYSIGNVTTDNISSSSCLAFPSSNNFNREKNRPWGGLITIKGGIDNSGSSGTTKYRVEYSNNGTDYLPVTTSQKITTIDFSNPSNPYTYHDLNDENGWFPYLANHDENNLVVINDNVMATWASHSFEGEYFIRISYTKDDPTSSTANIQHSAAIKIKLDNRRFRVNNAFDANNILDADLDVDMTIDGGVCRVYKQGDALTGKVKVRDTYYGGYNLSIQPASQIIDTAGLVNYAPGAKLNNSNPSEMGPTNEPFTIDTGKLQKCGYTLRLRGYERTILNNNHNFPYADKYIGFSVQ